MASNDYTFSDIEVDFPDISEPGSDISISDSSWMHLSSESDSESSDEYENARGYSFFDDDLVMEIYNSARDGGENVPLESFEGSHHPVRLLEPRRTVGDVILVTGTPANHHRTSGNELLAFGPLLLNEFRIFFYQRTLGGEENGDGGENVPAHDSSERSKKRKHAERRKWLRNIRKFQRAEELIRDSHITLL